MGGFSSSGCGHFAPERTLEAVADVVKVVGICAEEVHEFGDSGFEGDVVTADDADAVEFAAGFVLSHDDGTGLALGDVEDDDAALEGVVHGLDKPFFGGGVAAAKGFDDDAVEIFGVEDGVDHLGRYAGEEFEDSDVAVELFANLEGFGAAGHEEMRFEAEFNACLGQGGEIETSKGIEVFGADFGAAVAAIEVVFEEEADLGDVGFAARGQLQGADDVLTAVGA